MLDLNPIRCRSEIVLIESIPEDDWLSDTPLETAKLLEGRYGSWASAIFLMSGGKLWEQEGPQPLEHIFGTGGKTNISNKRLIMGKDF